MTSPRVQRRLIRDRWIAGHLENGRRAAECAAVGLLWTAFSVPIVTAGAAWVAAATVFDAWSRDEEPALVPTFLRSMRTNLRVGFVAQLAVAAIVVFAYFDIRFATAAHAPGARLEAAAVGLIAASAIGIIQLALSHRAHSGNGLLESVRGVLTLSPWAIPVVVVATAICVLLVAIIPALILVITGPLAYAVSVVYTRASLADR